MSVLSTVRDRALLYWLNGLGVVTIDEVVAHWGMQKATAYKRLRKLVQAKWLLHERYYYGQAGVYRVTALGCQVGEDSLPPLRRVSIGVLRHDLLVAKLSVRLRQQHPMGQFVTERRLRQQLGIRRFAQTEHVSDGLLCMPNQRLAIEVELTLKSQARRVGILDEYALQSEVDAVWYFCGSKALLAKFQEHQAEYPFLRCVNLGDYLRGQAKLV